MKSSLLTSLITFKDCSIMACNVSEHKRCYIDYLSDTTDLTCQCLKGLYTNDKNGQFECLGICVFEMSHKFLLNL